MYYLFFKFFFHLVLFFIPGNEEGNGIIIRNKIAHAFPLLKTHIHTHTSIMNKNKNLKQIKGKKAEEANPITEATNFNNEKKLSFDVL